MKQINIRDRWRTVKDAAGNRLGMEGFVSVNYDKTKSDGFYNVYSKIVRLCVYDALCDARQLAQEIDPSIKYSPNGERAA